jgi:hypothetical protein
MIDRAGMFGSFLATFLISRLPSRVKHRVTKKFTGGGIVYP